MVSYEGCIFFWFDGELIYSDDVEARDRFLGSVEKGAVDAEARFGGHLGVVDFLEAGELLRLLCGDHAVDEPLGGVGERQHGDVWPEGCDEVELVCEQDEDGLDGGAEGDPHDEVLQGLDHLLRDDPRGAAHDVEDHQDDGGAGGVDGEEGPGGLLARAVPDAEDDGDGDAGGGVADQHALVVEAGAESDRGVLGELFADEPADEGGLAHALVANQDCFELNRRISIVISRI